MPPGELNTRMTRCCRIPAASMSFVLFASKNLTMPKNISLRRSRFSPSFIKPNRVKSFFELTALAQFLQSLKLFSELRRVSLGKKYQSYKLFSHSCRRVESIQWPKLAEALLRDQVLSGQGQTKFPVFHYWNDRQLRTVQSFECKWQATLPNSSLKVHPFSNFDVFMNLSFKWTSTGELTKNRIFKRSPYTENHYLEKNVAYDMMVSGTIFVTLAKKLVKNIRSGDNHRRFVSNSSEYVSPGGVHFSIRP